MTATMQTTNRSVALLIIVVLLSLFAWMVHGVILPLALAGLFAVILAPLNRKLGTKLGRRSSWSASLVVLAAVILIVAPLSIMTFMGIRTALKHLRGDSFAATRQRISDLVGAQLERVARLMEPLGLDTSAESLKGSVGDTLQEAGSHLTDYLGSFAANVPAAVIGIFLFILGLFFFLRDGAPLMRWCVSALPFRRADTERLFISVRDAVRGVVLGSILTGVVQSSLCLIALLVLGVPAAFLWGTLAFLLSFIPTIGTTPVTAGATLYLLFSGRMAAGIGMGVAGVLIGLSDNLVRPLVQDAQAKMHPLLTLLAIFGGLQTLGAAGIFLGPVIAAMVVWSIQTYAAWRNQESPPPAA